MVDFRCIKEIEWGIRICLFTGDAFASSISDKGAEEKDGIDEKADAGQDDFC